MSTRIYEVRHTESSEYDLDGIFRYIAVDLCEPLTAGKLLTEIDDAIGKLCKMPERCPLVNIPERLFKQSGYIDAE